MVTCIHTQTHCEYHIRTILTIFQLKSFHTFTIYYLYTHYMYHHTKYSLLFIHIRIDTFILLTNCKKMHVSAQTHIRRYSRTTQIPPNKNPNTTLYITYTFSQVNRDSHLYTRRLIAPIIYESY